LFVPKQAVREFARHRSKYVAEAFEEMRKIADTLPQKPKLLDAPLFEGMPEYKAVSDGIDKLKQAIDDFRGKVEKLVTAARYNNNNDAVSKFYSELFTARQFIDHEKGRDDLLRDVAYRTLHNIPPGYKDKGKGDGGIGDVAIWHSLLKLANDQKRDVIF